MFGLMKGARHLSKQERQQWIGHVCGLCLTLRDHQGQMARPATNWDAALLSVLCEAQTAVPMHTYRQVCGLRGFQAAQVVAADNPGSQYAAAVALTMGAARVADHVADGDGWLKHLPGLGRRLSHRWQQAGQEVATQVDVNLDIVAQQADKQEAVEAKSGRDFAFYAHPTEIAVANAFAYTAVIAQVPQNQQTLYEIGLLFGRIMFLLDSYRDYAEDIERGAFNALAAAFGAEDMESEAQQIFRRAYAQLKRHFKQLDLPQPHLARKLLIDHLRRTGQQTLGGIGCATCSCRAPKADLNMRVNKISSRKRKERSFCCFDCCICCSDEIECQCCCVELECCDSDGCCELECDCCDCCTGGCCECCCCGD